MAFQIPDLKQIVQRSRNAFRAEMPGTDAWIWPSNVYVAAKVFGGIVWELFVRLRWVDKQRFAMTATGYELERHGNEYGISRNPAIAAQGFVDVPCAHPYSIPSGTTFRRSDDVVFTVTATVSAKPFAVSQVVPVPVICTTPGKAGNTLAGTPLTTTLNGLSDNTTVVTVSDAGIGQGADVETDEQLRARILARKRKPPMGGASYDYEEWAKETGIGVTRVFVKGNAFGRGTVGIWFLMDDTYPAGIPQQADVDVVQDYIDAKAPVTVKAFVLAPTPSGVDVIVKGVSPATPAVYKDIALELKTLFRKMVKPGLPDEPFNLRHSWLEQAVSNVAGEDYHEGVISPASDLPFIPGVMPYLNSVRFVQGE